MINISFVGSGLYLGCLPYIAIHSAVENGQLITLNTPDLHLHRCLYFVGHKNAGDNPLHNCILLETKPQLLVLKKTKEDIFKYTFSCFS